MTSLTVVVLEFIPTKWWHHLLHHQTALLLKAALLFRKNTIVVSVPYHLEELTTTLFAVHFTSYAGRESPGLPHTTLRCSWA